MKEELSNFKFYSWQDRPAVLFLNADQSIYAVSMSEYQGPWTEVEATDVFISGFEIREEEEFKKFFDKRFGPFELPDECKSRISTFADEVAGKKAKHQPGSLEVAGQDEDNAVNDVLIPRYRFDFEYRGIKFIGLALTWIIWVWIRTVDDWEFVGISFDEWEDDMLLVNTLFPILLLATAFWFPNNEYLKESKLNKKMLEEKNILGFKLSEKIAWKNAAVAEVKLARKLIQKYSRNGEVIGGLESNIGRMEISEIAFRLSQTRFQSEAIPTVMKVLRDRLNSNEEEIQLLSSELKVMSTKLAEVNSKIQRSYKKLYPR